MNEEQFIKSLSSEQLEFFLNFILEKNNQLIEKNKRIMELLDEKLVLCKENLKQLESKLS